MLLAIDKLIYGGSGLARMPADDKGPGKAVFLPFVLEGERVEAEIVEQKPGFARARATKIVEASPQRIAPPCPYFGECGGCHYQHTTYEHQLQIKSAILRETLRRVANIEFDGEIQVHAAHPWNYRNRTRMRLRTQPFLLGYSRMRWNDLLPVEECPISSPLINGAIGVLWDLGRANRVSADITEVEFFANAEDKQLLLELTLKDASWRLRRKSDVLDFVRTLRAAMPEVAGVAVFHQDSGGWLEREHVPGELQEIFGADHLRYSTPAGDYEVSAGSFFQINRFLISTLLDLVTRGRSGHHTFDLYAGAGLFSLALAKAFSRVSAVESAPFSFRDLKHNCPPNVNCFREPVAQFLAGQGRAFDLAVVDPPRAGLGKKVAELLAASGTPRITYVSCHPATLARDLTVLMESGYRIEELHLIDLFPQTYHIESVLQIVR